MKRILLCGLAGLILVPFVAGAALPVFTVPAGLTNIAIAPGSTNSFPQYLNNGTVFNAQIDAVTFVNNGTFIASANYLPYETSSTLYYTNNGLMLGAVGFRFDCNPSTVGSRRPSASFFNGTLATIEAVDTGLSLDMLGYLMRISPSYLLISATNIQNGGVLHVGGDGVMKLTGSDVKVAQSSLEVTPIGEQGSSGLDSYTVLSNSFIPAVGIYDLYWAATNYAPNFLSLNTPSIWDGVIATAPGVPPGPGSGLIPSFSILPTLADSYTNVAGVATLTLTNKGGTTYTTTLFTNLNKGAVFVAAPPEFSVQAGFTPGQSNFNNIGVLLSLLVTNRATGAEGASYIFFKDTLASQGGKGILENFLYGTGRPTNYVVTRLNTSPGTAGNNGYPAPDFFLSSGNKLVNSHVDIDEVTNTIVESGSYSAYSPYIDNVASRPSSVTGGTITNLPGSVWISADNLDLDRTRINANGFISISASHLVSSTNLVLDCGNLLFDLGSTNGHLLVTNLATSAIAGQIQGPMTAWSATWSNTVVLVITNNWIEIPDTNVPPGKSTYSNSPVTNVFAVGYDVFILDASALRSVQPVYVYDLILHAKDITVGDNMTVLESLLIDGRSFTLNGNIGVPGVFPPLNPITGAAFQAAPLANWIFTNAPKLLYFTNNGWLRIPNEAHFGDDRPPYSTFINAGRLDAAGININSTYFENEGRLEASAGALSVQSASGKLQYGNSFSANFSQFTGGNFKFFNFGLVSDSSLIFNVTNSLFDPGPDSANSFQVKNGFSLLVKPQTGDLLGTTLQTEDPTTNGRAIYHKWTGEDFGPTPAGYVNNQAIGTLRLTTRSAASVFIFSGIGTMKAMYVDLLDLSSLTNLPSQLQIDPNLKIYFGAVQLSFTPPDTNGASLTPEEYMDGQFNGRLRWVQSYAGANSYVDAHVLVDGVEDSMRVNAALRNSLIIDSDGDGLANGDDPVPFAAARLSVHVNGGGTVSPNCDGQLLLVGQTYAMIAQPADGFVFAGWTGSANTTSREVTFVMTNGFHLVANFTYSALPGSYSGLFAEPEPNGVGFQRSGAISLKTTTGGKYSGKLQIAAKRYSFSGWLTNGLGAISIPKTELVLQLQGGDKQITGTVSDRTNYWTANLRANRSVFDSRTNAAPFAGKYTVIFPGSGDLANVLNPFGDGYGVVTVKTSGQLSLKGALADGTKISQTATVSGDGEWPLYLSLYGGQGQVFGWLAFAGTVEQNPGGLFNWIKLPNSKAKLYHAGFEIETNAIGSFYNSSSVPVTTFGNGVVVLSGGNLFPGIVNDVTVSSDNKVTSSTDSKLKLTLKPAQGSFSGSVPDTHSGKKVKFNGVILQSEGFGSGCFLGSSESGRVDFIP